MTTAEVKQLIIDAATRNGISPDIPLAIAQHESGFNPSATHLNANGTTDWGVMQLNDLTVRTLGVKNPLDAEENVNAGVGLISSLLRKYNGDSRLALWAYASGSGTVDKGGVPNAVASQFIAYVQARSGGSYLPDAPEGKQPPDGTQYDQPSDSEPLIASNTGVFIGLGLAAGGLLLWWLVDLSS